jgi:hypothetical protein
MRRWVRRCFAAAAADAALGVSLLHCTAACRCLFGLCCLSDLPHGPAGLPFGTERVRVTGNHHHRNKQHTDHRRARLLPLQQRPAVSVRGEHRGRCPAQDAAIDSVVGNALFVVVHRRHHGRRRRRWRRRTGSAAKSEPADVGGRRGQARTPAQAGDSRGAGHRQLPGPGPSGHARACVRAYVCVCVHVRVCARACLVPPSFGIVSTCS